MLFPRLFCRLRILLQGMNSEENCGPLLHWPNYLAGSSFCQHLIVFVIDTGKNRKTWRPTSIFVNDDVNDDRVCRYPILPQCHLPGSQPVNSSQPCPLDQIMVDNLIVIVHSSFIFKMSVNEVCWRRMLVNCLKIISCKHEMMDSWWIGRFFMWCYGLCINRQ